MIIAFDFDGTIVDCEARQSAVLKSIVSTREISIDVKKVWEKKRLGLNTREALIQIGLPAKQAGIIHSAWVSEIENYGWLQLDQLIPGATDILKLHQVSGHQLILLSARKRPEWLLCQLGNLGLKKYFTKIVCVDPGFVTSEKARAMNELGAQIYIGDTESDHQAAVMAGVTFVAVGSGQRTKQVLTNNGCLTVLDSIAKFSRPIIPQ
jgi:hypothetical protein